MRMKCCYFNKAQADRCLWRIYRRIALGEVVVRLNRDTEKMVAATLDIGEEDAVITINPNDPIIDCFMHEYLHIFFHDAKESVIERMEKELMSHWTDRQLETLLRRLVKLVRLRPVNAGTIIAKKMQFSRAVTANTLIGKTQ